ncbi:MAG: lipopolysaccharide biosynthesis protein [Marinifilaceae bacterium]
MTDNFRVAKNSLFLYLRMILLMAISLYTSRILLDKLGVEDFGIYDVVGGVVALFLTLKGVFASATQRFLNYAIGKNSRESLNEIFNMSIIVHIGISVLFLILSESIGLWFLTNKLVISPERLDAALIVFHLSVLSTVVIIMTVPFDAIIIANQRMKFFAYSSILNGILRLIVILTFTYIGADNLITYAVLLLLVSLIIRLVNVIYCRRNFDEYKYRFVWNNELLKEMSLFAGWNILGTFTFTITTQGINFVLNMFGGVILNAARGISYQVNSAVSQLISNVVLAVQPHAVQLYAKNEKDEYYKVLFFSSKVIILVYLIIFFPLYLFIQEILQLWLVSIPDHAIEFVRSMLLYLLIRSLHNPIDIFFKTIGKLKYYQLIEFFIISSSLPLGYIGLTFALPSYSVFLIMAGVELINFISICALAKRKYDFNTNKWIYGLLVPMLIIVGIILGIYYLTVNYFLFGWLCNVNIILIGYGISFYILTDKSERSVIYSFATKFLKKI